MSHRDIRYQAAIVRHDRLLLVRWEPFSWPAVWLVPGGGREAESEEEGLEKLEALAKELRRGANRV